LARASLLAGVIGAAFVAWPGLQCMVNVLNNEQFSNLSEAEEVWVYGGRQGDGAARPGSGAQGAFSRRLFGGIAPCSWAAVRHADDWKGMLAAGGLVGFVLLSWFNHLSWRRGVVRAARAPVRTTQANIVVARPSAAWPAAEPSGSRTAANPTVTGSRTAANPAVTGSRTAANPTVTSSQSAAHDAVSARAARATSSSTSSVTTEWQRTGSTPIAPSGYGTAGPPARPAASVIQSTARPDTLRFASDDDWDDIPVPSAPGRQEPDPGSPFDHLPDEQFLIDAGLQDRTPKKN
jgi:hypothetical protein